MFGYTYTCEMITIIKTNYYIQYLYLDTIVYVCWVGKIEL